MNDVNPEFLQMTANTIGEKLLAGLVQEIRIMPDCWQKLTEHKQEDIIERLSSRVHAAVTLATHMIASSERVTVVGKLEQITTKSKIKAVFVISPTSEGRHELQDSVEKDCLLIIASADEHMGNMKSTKADPDQSAMDLNGGDGSMENANWGGDAPDENEPIDGEFLSLGVEKFAGLTLGDICRSVVLHFTTVDVDKLQSRFAVDSATATRLILLMLEEGVIELHDESINPLENTYKVIKALTDLDLNLE
ncbi:MAG TPA: cell division protein FtsK [Pseudomonas sp.]|uniref:cell division protein FtsK n=1 Tax=Pseudomonas sp. TaxID=306 RepID=UPI002C0F0A51|nr:cell division protein FtsK [Pseudomonas sp.]HWH86192.1 cell division protein FtsK [Pseudomonas sp.]